MIHSDDLIVKQANFTRSDEVVDVALSNLVITADPLPNSVHSFAEKADSLGYLGRNGYDLSGIFYSFDTNSLEEAST